MEGRTLGPIPYKSSVGEREQLPAGQGHQDRPGCVLPPCCCTPDRESLRLCGLLGEPLPMRRSEASLAPCPVICNLRVLASTRSALPQWGTPRPWPAGQLQKPAGCGRGADLRALRSPPFILREDLRPSPPFFCKPKGGDAALDPALPAPPGPRGSPSVPLGLKLLPGPPASSAVPAYAIRILEFENRS